MNTRTRAVLMAAAVAMSASALGSQAADYFETQREMTDGAVAVPYHLTPARVAPATPGQAAQDSWFDRERAQPQTVVPFVAPVQATRAPLKPATARQAAQDAWFDRERAQPLTAVPYVPPSALAAGDSVQDAQANAD